MILAAIPLIFAISSADAVAARLNSPNSCSARTYAAAKKKVLSDAEKGYPLQQFVIGVTTDDEALAKKFLNASRNKIRTMAESKNNPLSWYLLSMESNDMSMLNKAAKLGNVQALNALGTIMIRQAFDTSLTPSTNSVEKALKSAYACFNRAAEQNDPNGFINLGTCYLKGFGCKQDMALAFECFRTAAQAGHPEGMDNLSACYQFGHGAAKDDERSLFWAMKGRAARGDKAAEKWLQERK